MTIYRINTTAFEEEDFFLLTNLTEQQITMVVNPIVMAERDGYEEYDNETIVNALQQTYPNNQVVMIVEFEQLSY